MRGGQISMLLAALWEGGEAATEREFNAFVKRTGGYVLFMSVVKQFL
jgi:hypothetical protein